MAEPLGCLPLLVVLPPEEVDEELLLPHAASASSAMIAAASATINRGRLHAAVPRRASSVIAPLLSSTAAPKWPANSVGRALRAGSTTRCARLENHQARSAFTTRDTRGTRRRGLGGAAPRRRTASG